MSCSKDDCDLDHIDKLQGLPALKAGTFPEEDLTLNVGEQYVYAPKASSPVLRSEEHTSELQSPC